MEIIQDIEKETDGKKKRKENTGIQASATAHPQKEAKWSSHMLSLFLLKRHLPLSSQYHVKRL